jgi:MFS family permease
MTRGESLKVAFGGLMAMAAALGIGRFAYTPILPFMLDALGWSKADAGLVASANFLGYLAGAIIASVSVFSSSPRTWLLIALAASATTTAGMGLLSGMIEIVIVRFIGGVASAFVIVCASTLVLDRLSAAGRDNLVAIHFAGVGAGIFVSVAVVAAVSMNRAAWRSLWVASGSVAALGTPRCSPASLNFHSIILSLSRRGECLKVRTRQDDRGLWPVRVRLCDHGDLFCNHRAPIPADSGS